MQYDHGISIDGWEIGITVIGIDGKEECLAAASRMVQIHQRMGLASVARTELKSDLDKLHNRIHLHYLGMMQYVVAETEERTAPVLQFVCLILDYVEALQREYRDEGKINEPAWNFLAVDSSEMKKVIYTAVRKCCDTFKKCREILHKHMREELLTLGYSDPERQVIDAVGKAWLDEMADGEKVCQLMKRSLNALEENIKSIMEEMVGPLLTKFVKPSPTPESSCSVCVEKLDDSQEVLLLKCKHVFHRSCIQAWMVNSLKCPLCRDTCIDEISSESRFKDNIDDDEGGNIHYIE